MSIPRSIAIFKGFIDETADIFVSFIAVWITWQLVVNIILRNKASIEMLYRLLVFVGILAVMRGADVYIDYFIFPILKIVNSLLVAVIETGIGDNLVIGEQVGDLQGMLVAVDQCILQSIKMFEAIVHENGFILFKIVNTFLAALVIAPYIFMGIMFACFVGEYILKVTAFIALSPFLLICAAFPSTENAFRSAGRVVLQAVVVLFLSLLAISMGLDLAHESIGNLADVEGEEYLEVIRAWMLSEDYWRFFISGAVSGYFLKKVSTISSNIVGAPDSSGAAAVVAGAGTALYTGAITMGGKGILAGAVGKAAFKGAGGSIISGGKAAGKAVWRSMKSK